MKAITVVEEKDGLVTLSRADFDRLLDAVGDVQDLAVVQANRLYEARVGVEKARRDYLTAEETLRIIDGESLVRIWRERRQLTQRALAEASGVAQSLLAEIETGAKTGSVATVARLARALDVPVDWLIREPEASL